MKIRSAAMLVAVISFLGCGTAPQESAPTTLAEFRAAAYQEPDTGLWITNGDELAETEADLQAAFDRYLAGTEAAAAAAEPVTRLPLIVNTVGGADDRWSSATAVNLTYCVSSSSFGSRYSAVVTAMSSAAAAWEGTANVNFVHASTQDGSCTSRNNNVVFNVRQVSTTQYLARAFFPSTSRRGREVLISTSSFGNITPYTLAGILRHELGHTIGFRHEHTRPEAAACFEDNNWRALTAYDAASVMHYPQCNGTNKGDLVLTSLDSTGARALYP
jgi:hypothetical protein